MSVGSRVGHEMPISSTRSTIRVPCFHSAAVNETAVYASSPAVAVHALGRGVPLGHPQLFVVEDHASRKILVIFRYGNSVPVTELPERRFSPQASWLAMLRALSIAKP